MAEESELDQAKKGARRYLLALGIFLSIPAVLCLLLFLYLNHEGHRIRALHRTVSNGKLLVEAVDAYRDEHCRLPTVAALD